MRESPRGLIASALGLVAAVALSGCGGSSLTSGQLRSVATRSCTVTTRQLDRIAIPTSGGQGQRFIALGAAALGREVSELRALHASGTFADAVRVTAAEVSALEFTIRGLRAGNDPVVAIKTLQARLHPLEDRADRDWRTLGIKACTAG